MHRSTFRAELKRKVMALPKERRQEFLDYMWQGMKLGDAAAKAGIEFYEAATLLDMNIKRRTIYTLGKESV